MKIYILSIIISLFISHQLQAQQFYSGSTALRISGGLVNDFWQSGGKIDFYANIGFDKYTKSQNKWVYGIEYVKLNSLYKDIHFPISVFTGEIGFYKHLFSIPYQSLHIYLGGSLLAGYETINWGKKNLSDGAIIVNNDNFIYGGALTLEIEYLLWDKGVLFLDIREKVKANSSFSTFDFLLGLGFKLIF